jgi:hypothetical protein
MESKIEDIIEYHVAKRENDTWWVCKEVSSIEDALETLNNLKRQDRTNDYQIVKKTISFEVLFHDSAQLDLF